MSRSVEFTSDRLILHLTGLTSVGALRRRVEIPYSQIIQASISDFKISLFQFRVGTSIADVREGRFLIDGSWCFISYENHNDVIVLELKDHEFKQVVFQIEDPVETERLIAKHLLKYKM
ncbi:hypothetical protein SAMN03159341_10117 [Paenibacillus sp. 1_12]|uniref:hypothetical protein n=1 Tax=Paenibacillus sp. 1_12 TaxID=1566278 RepID=UPI0008E3B78F|nr:hypothetical protein [Paenibacillus sp. 1_12]SFK67100.1 hypothetical protein SAMN03159341_10117 [Paenibacillus sp. 1_12]